MYVCTTEAVFTLGARALVPGHRHKMVLCSDTGYPIYHCPVQCPSTRSRPFPRARALCPNSGVGTWKSGVFTLVPIKNRSRAPCSGTKSERSLRVVSSLIFQSRNKIRETGFTVHRNPSKINYSQFKGGGVLPIVIYTVGSPKGFFSIISKRPTKRRKCVFSGYNTSIKIEISKMDAGTLLLMKGLPLLSKSERSLSA